MKSFLKQNSLYLLLYACILFYTGNYLLSHGKVQIHQQINSWVGNKSIDLFFKYITHLGDGLFAIIIAVILAFSSLRKSLYILLSYFSAALLSTILKHYVFTEIYRPHFVFQYFVREELRLVDGVDMLGLNSFPSGHSLSAFSLFFCLIFISKNHLYKIAFFALAILAAFSRTYLSQHWLIDIYVGSIIGSCFALVYYFVFYRRDLNKTLNQPIQTFFGKKNRV